MPHTNRSRRASLTSAIDHRHSDIAHHRIVGPSQTSLHPRSPILPIGPPRLSSQPLTATAHHRRHFVPSISGVGGRSFISHPSLRGWEDRRINFTHSPIRPPIPHWVENSHFGSLCPFATSDTYTRALFYIVGPFII